MYVVKKFATPLELTKFLRGTEIYSGTCSITGSTLTDDDGTDLEALSTPVAAGQVVYIGDGGAATLSESTVASVAAAVITLDDTVGTASAGTSYRVTTEKHLAYGASRNIVQISFDSLSSTWICIYDTDEWTNG